MKSTIQSKAVALLVVFCLGIVSNKINAQVQTPKYISITTNTNGYYEYLPEGYSSGADTYPLIIFIGGYGECGDGSVTDLPKVLHFGPPFQISEGIFPTSFTVAGQTYKFIIISPQFTQLPRNSEINDVISYALQNYRVDPKRVYMTGASMGGGVCWDYAGENISYANRLAAMVPICGASYPDAAKANNIAAANIAVWATHSVDDVEVPSEYTAEYIDLINSAAVPPNPLAKKTFFPGSDHNAWTPTYDLNFKEDGVNVYEWMLQYQRSFVVLPVTGLQFSVSKKSNNKILLEWKTYSEKNNRGFEIQRSKDGLSFDSVTFVKSKSINGGVYDITDESPFNSKIYYRLKLIDLNNVVTYSQVRFADLAKINSISISPNPVRNILNLVTDQALVNADLSIINADGKLIKKLKINGTGTVPVSVENLPTGVYTAHLSATNMSVKIMFLKQ